MSFKTSGMDGEITRERESQSTQHNQQARNNPALHMQQQHAMLTFIQALLERPREHARVALNRCSVEDGLSGTVCCVQDGPSACKQGH